MIYGTLEGKILKEAEWLKDWNFDLLLKLMEQQLGNAIPGSVNYFGFAFHDHQMTVDDAGLPQQVDEAYEALDRFLTKTDSLVKAGKYRYARSIDIYEEFLKQEKMEKIK